MKRHLESTEGKLCWDHRAQAGGQDGGGTVLQTSSLTAKTAAGA